jgi:prepilin-type N-terminal cleavage/methylation domain-containing protein
MNHNFSQKAFTLIEILLVTSIVSLLSTVVVNESKTSRLKADDAHMKTETQQLANAVNLYKNDNNGKVPVGDTQISEGYPIVYENNTDGTAAAYQESMQILVDEGYIPEIPTSPTGQSYSYYVTEDQENAMFSAKLNFETSSAGSNSCEFVQVESYDPQLCYQDNSILADFSGEDVNFILEEDKLYFTSLYYSDPNPYAGFSNVLSKDDFCNAYGDSQCYGGDGTRADLCESRYSEGGSIPLGGFGGLGGLGGGNSAGVCTTIFGSIEVVCPIANEVVCDGSSNSDYCSCI